VRACSGVQSCYVRHCSEVQEVCGNFDGTFSPRKNACIKMRTSRDQSPPIFPVEPSYRLSATLSILI